MKRAVIGHRHILLVQLVRYTLQVQADILKGPSQPRGHWQVRCWVIPLVFLLGGRVATIVSVFFLFSVTIGPVCFRSVIPDALPDIPWPSDEGCCPCAPRLPVPFSFDFGGGSSAIVTLPVAPTVAFVRTSAPSAMPFGYACLNVCLNVLNRSPRRSGHLPAL